MAVQGRMMAIWSGPSVATQSLRNLRSVLLPWLVLLLMLVGLAAPAHAQGVLPVPALSARVIDQTGTLGAEQISALQERLKALEDKHGSQVVVLMVPTTAPEDIASYANRVANVWKIGRRDVGDCNSRFDGQTHHRWRHHARVQAG